MLAEVWQYSTTTGWWTWVRCSTFPSHQHLMSSFLQSLGTNAVNVASVFGTKGTPSVSNVPGNRLFHAFGVDSELLTVLCSGTNSVCCGLQVLTTYSFMEG